MQKQTKQSRLPATDDSSPRIQIVNKQGIFIAIPEKPLKALTAESVLKIQESLRNRFDEESIER